MKIIDLKHQSNKNYKTDNVVENSEFVKGLFIYNKNIGLVGKVKGPIKTASTRIKTNKDVYLPVEKLWAAENRNKAYWWFVKNINPNDILNTTNIYVLNGNIDSYETLPSKEEIENFDIDEDATINLNRFYLDFMSQVNKKN